MPAETDYDTALQAVVTATRSADWAAADQALLEAEVHLNRMELSEGFNGANTSRRQSLKDLRDHLAAAKARSSGGAFERHSRWVP